jgi:hypothetical protein
MAGRSPLQAGRTRYHISLNHLLAGSISQERCQEDDGDYPSDRAGVECQMLERLAGTSLAVVPRVMERFGKAYCRKTTAMASFGAAEKLDGKKAALGYLNGDESRQLMRLKQRSEDGVKNSASRMNIFPMPVPQCRRG